MKQSNKLISGFTLVELAVVLVIVGILLGSTLSSLSSRIEYTRKNDSIEGLEQIKRAMMAYAFVNGYLPCPDCSNAAGDCAAAVIADGVSDYNVGANRCSVNEAVGNVPWVTLGLGRSDAWGTRYRYFVQNAYANSKAAFTLNGVAGPNGSAVIREPDFIKDATGATPRKLANNIVAVLFSHGPNTFGGSDENNVARAAIPAANIDELENTDGDRFFYTRPETAVGTTIAGGEFDDIVLWISEFELKAKMVEAGKLPL